MFAAIDEIKQSMLFHAIPLSGLIWSMNMAFGFKQSTLALCTPAGYEKYIILTFTINHQGPQSDKKPSKVENYGKNVK